MKTEHIFIVFQNSFHRYTLNFQSSDEYQNLSENGTKGINQMASNGVNGQSISQSQDANVLEYRVYPERWWLLSAVLLLNVSNYAHWVAFPVVVKVQTSHIQY